MCVKYLKAFALDLGPYMLSFIALFIAIAAHDALNIILPRNPDIYGQILRGLIALCVPTVLAVLLMVGASEMDRKFPRFCSKFR